MQIPYLEIEKRRDFAEFLQFLKNKEALTDAARRRTHVHMDLSREERRADN